MVMIYEHDFTSFEKHIKWQIEVCCIDDFAFSLLCPLLMTNMECYLFFVL